MVGKPLIWNKNTNDSIWRFLCSLPWRTRWETFRGFPTTFLGAVWSLWHRQAPPTHQGNANSSFTNSVPVRYQKICWYAGAKTHPLPRRQACSIVGGGGGFRVLLPLEICSVPSSLESHALSDGPSRPVAAILTALTRLKLELRAQCKISSLQASLANWFGQIKFSALSFNLLAGGREHLFLQ